MDSRQSLQKQGGQQQGHTGMLSRFFSSMGFTGNRSSTPQRPCAQQRGLAPSQPVKAHAASMSATQNTAGTHVTSTSTVEYEIDLGYPRSLVDKYDWGREIGKGGNGCVRVVTDKVTGLEYACKSIKKVLAEASEQKKSGHLQSIRREISVLNSLKGSLNIVKLEDVFEDSDDVHIVQELCKGGELWHRIGDRHYSERTVASFMRAVLRTLAQCHSHHILHRDVKPGNFMLLSEDDRAPLKAIDFGLASPYDPECLPKTDLGLEGTPWFMAPETLSSEWLPASDLWSAGVTAFQLLTGRFPFDDKKNPNNPSISAIWKGVLSEEPNFEQPWWAGVSEEAKDFVKMLLNKNPHLRPTAKEALKHPWLRGNSLERSTGRRIGQSVVQRIQRFASSSQFKRTVLQAIAAELLNTPRMQLERVCVINDKGRPVIDAPDASAMEMLYKQLHFDGRASVDRDEVATALSNMGFKLDPSEIDRLMEQVDLEGTGEWARAAFAASQMDWRHLQQNHAEMWLDMAKRAFSSLDADHDGVLQADQIIQCMRSKLPVNEVQDALEQVMQEAGITSTVKTINFPQFLQLLKVGSMDSLDLYDDRMSMRSGGSGHGSSLDRMNSLLEKSLRTGDWSRHGGAGALEGSTHSHMSELSDVTNLQDQSVHGAAGLDQSQNPSQRGLVGSPGKTASSPGMVWRFDVGPSKPAPVAEPHGTIWRFDVGSNADRAKQPAQTVEKVAARQQVHGGVTGTNPIPISSGAMLNVGRQGGYFDRRMHGENLYRNVVLKGGQAVSNHRSAAAGWALETVQE